MRKHNNREQKMLVEYRSKLGLFIQWAQSVRRPVQQYLERLDEIELWIDSFNQLKSKNVKLKRRAMVIVNEGGSVSTKPTMAVVPLSQSENLPLLVDRENLLLRRKSGDEENKDRLLAVAQRKVLEQRDTIRVLKENLKRKDRPSKEAMWRIADKHRKLNGTLNYAAISRELSITNKTAKTWCNEYRIK
jgi:hypothetical protein